MKIKRNTALMLMASALLVAALACVRSAPLADGEDPALATEKVALTADAEIQQTLDALLSSATVESAAATLAPTATATVAAPTATATLEQAQLTALAASLTAVAEGPTATAEFTATPSNTPAPTSTPCYAARYVYDESYPDGTRVDPGQLIAKTWRLQNVGTCDWPAGQYELYFVNGDRMNGTSPLTINISVPAGAYANFTVNLRAPATPGTYHGDWIFRFDGDDLVGVGPNYDLPFWVEIIVRGATPAP
jgi:hypothetical protein